MTNHFRDFGWGYVDTINIPNVLNFHVSTSNGV